MTILTPDSVSDLNRNVWFSLKILCFYHLKSPVRIVVVFESGLWIRIHFLRIRIRIQSLMLEANTDPDPNPDPDPIRIKGFNDQKLKKNYIWNSVFSSVTDPDPNPDVPDPHVFVPPRSGSGSDWIHQSEVWIRIRIHPKMSWIRNTGIFKHAFYLQFSQTQLSGKEIFAPSSSFSESEPDVESASGPPFNRMPPSINVQLLKTSVADPTPDPDPHVFGPPGSRSGSISQRYGSGTGSIGQMHRSADPDPHQTVMDPQHCWKPLNTETLRLKIRHNEP